MLAFNISKGVKSIYFIRAKPAIRRNKVFLQRRRQNGLKILLLIVALYFAPSTPCSAQNIEIIVNPDVPSHSLSMTAARVLFGMRLRVWETGSPVTVFVLDDREPLHRLFVKTKLNILPHQLRKSWDRLVFSGTGQAPVKVADWEEMKKKVATTPGAVGYLRGDLIDESIRKVSIE